MPKVEYKNGSSLRDGRPESSSKHKQPKCLKMESSVPVTAMNNRVSALLREANEISQYLHLDCIFTGSSSDSTEVKILNKTLGLCCTWSVTRLKEKLMKMRTFIYNADSDNSRSLAVNELFDSNDFWTHNSTEVNTSNDTNSIPYKDALNSVSRINSLAEESNTRNSLDSLNPTTSLSSSVANNSDNYERELSNASYSSSSAPCHFSSSKPVDGHKYSRHVPDKNLPIQSLLPQNIKSFDKSDGLPEKYLSGLSDEELKMVMAKASAASGGSIGRGGLRTVPFPRIKDPMQADRNNSLKSVNFRPSTGQRRMTLRPSSDAEVQTDASVVTVKDVSPFKLAKDLTTMALLRFSYCDIDMVLVDRILCACESIRQGVQRLLTSRTSTAATQFCDMEKLSVQVSVSLEILKSHIQTWCSILHNPEDPVLVEQQQNLLHAARDLTKDVLTLWQSCESEANEIVNDSVLKILNLLQQLSVECGKIAATLEICPQILSDQKKASLEQIISQKAVRIDDLLNAQPSCEIKLSFLAGCDITVDRSLDQCLQSADLVHGRVKSLTELCQKDQHKVSREILLLICAVVKSCRKLFLQLQQIQIELHSMMTENGPVSDGGKPTYNSCSYFERCVAMVREVQRLQDNLELLKQTAEALQNEVDGGILRKICRCAEMVQRTTNRLLSSCDCRKNLQEDVIVESSDGSDLRANMLLLLGQETRLCEAHAEVEQATGILCNMIKDKLATDFAQNAELGADKIKRLLPVTPRRMQTMRCQSAGIFDQQAKVFTQFSFNSLYRRNTAI